MVSSIHQMLLEALGSLFLQIITIKVVTKSNGRIAHDGNSGIFPSGSIFNRKTPELIVPAIT
jgi:hypothetical protein